MSSLTPYFTHDFGARNDPKLVNLQIKHGMSGLGVYWCLVEMLYEQSGEMLLEYERISWTLRIDTNVVFSVINDFDLFIIDEKMFSSESVLKRIELRNAKSIKARESINSRWKKHRKNTIVSDIDTFVSENDTNVTKNDTIKERKEKKSKINKSKVKQKEKLWVENFDVYKIECEKEFKKFTEDEDIINEQKRLNPGVDILLSVEKGFINFWSKEAGWKNKKKSGSAELDWNQTFVNSIDINKVYIQKSQQNGDIKPIPTGSKESKSEKLLRLCQGDY